MIYIIITILHLHSSMMLSRGGVYSVHSVQLLTGWSGLYCTGQKVISNQVSDVSVLCRLTHRKSSNQLSQSLSDLLTWR